MRQLGNVTGARGRVWHPGELGVQRMEGNKTGRGGNRSKAGEVKVESERQDETGTVRGGTGTRCQDENEAVSRSGARMSEGAKRLSPYPGQERSDWTGSSSGHISWSVSGSGFSVLVSHRSSVSVLGHGSHPSHFGLHHIHLEPPTPTSDQLAFRYRGRLPPHRPEHRPEPDARRVTSGGYHRRACRAPHPIDARSRTLIGYR